MAFLQNLLSQHTLIVAGACFTLVSYILSGVATALQAIGDQVPGWLGTVSGWAGSAVHFINGFIVPPSGGSSGSGT